MAIGFQRKQHGERRQMDVVVTVMAMAVVMVMIRAMIMVAVIVVVMMTMVMSMMVVAMVPAVMGAAVFLRLAFIQLKRLAHTDVVFAHR